MSPELFLAVGVAGVALCTPFVAEVVVFINFIKRIIKAFFAGLAGQLLEYDQKEKRYNG